MKSNYLVINESVEPSYNLALEEYLLLHFTEGRIVMLWQNENTIVIGRNQNALEEIDQDYVRKQGIKVVRRTTGGGAVYHDLGNLNYSFITDYEKDGGMQEFTGIVEDALKGLGVNASFSGKNDIFAGGKKISGMAQRVAGNRVLYHGCLLFDSDLQKLANSLHVQADKFQSKAVKSIKSRVGNLKDFLGEDIGIEKLKDCLVKEFLKEGEYQLLCPSDLDKNERLIIRKLQNEKYGSWEWNFGNSIKYAVHNRKKFDGGTVEVYMDIREGRIVKCRIYGDFMSSRPVSDIAEKLVGTRHKYEEVMEVLTLFRLSDYFGIISAQDAASVICL